MTRGLGFPDLIHVLHIGHATPMSPRELIDALVDEVPAPDHAEPSLYVVDDLLPRALAPVDPAACVLTSVRSVWGPSGVRN